MSQKSFRMMLFLMRRIFVKNIWVPLSGQIAQQRKVETIANNIANANTPGFKKDQLVFKEHLTALTKGMEDIDIPRKEFSPDDFYHTQGGQNAFVDVDGSYTIFEQGQLQPTNNSFDLALNGKGMFEVLTPNGIRYTRRGTFTLSKEGELVTDSGYKVLKPLTAATDESTPNVEDRFIKIDSTKKFSVSPAGEIFTQDGQIGKLSIVEFKDIHAIKKEGNSLFVNNDEDNLLREEIKTTVNQGFIETSNVNAIQEMSELIRAHRHFDNIQKAISTYDNISGKAVNDIAKF